MTDTNSHDKRFEELCAGYVLQILDEKEKEEFEALLAEATDEQQRLYQLMLEISHQPAFSIEEDESSKDLREKLLAKVREESESSIAKTGIPPVAREEEDFNWSSFAVATSFALLIISLSLLFYSFNLGRQMSDQEKLIASQEKRISELQAEIQQKEELLTILASQEVEVVHLSGMESNPGGYGKIIWDPETGRALLQVSNLPPVPDGKAYQLWIIRNNEYFSAGTFVINSNEDRFFKFDQIGNSVKHSVEAFAVTLEPAGGRPQPTGDMYLMGNRTSERQ